jgi:hypothetical protein
LPSARYERLGTALWLWAPELDSPCRCSTRVFDGYEMNPSIDENVAIEFHDSNMVGLEARDGKLVVVLAAYLHRSSDEPGSDPGTGWSETAHVHVVEGIVLEHSGSLPMRLDDGSVETRRSNRACSRASRSTGV